MGSRILGELLRAFSGAHRPRSRGRPKADTAADVSHGSQRLVFEVFVRERALTKIRGKRRGVRAEAIRNVALRYKVDAATLKREVTRHHDLLLVVNALSKIAESADELQSELRRRLRGMPPEVLKLLLPLSAARLCDWLRAEEIDGDCPGWLLDIARTD